jgi:hypothetical protein
MRRGNARIKSAERRDIPHDRSGHVPNDDPGMGREQRELRLAQRSELIE